MRFDIAIPKYGWSSLCYICPNKGDTAHVLETLVHLGAEDKILQRVADKLRNGEPNEGFTFSAKMQRRSVMFITNTDSAEEFMNTLVHEIRHLTDDIATAYNIALTGEDVAYLAGEIAQRMFQNCHSLLCDCCRGK